MSQLATVIGIERTCEKRYPSGIECDACGVIFRDINGHRVSEERLRSDASYEGWSFVSNGDLCGNCYNE